MYMYFIVILFLIMEENILKCTNVLDLFRKLYFAHTLKFKVK
jgi:hypothetical protein